ncbi:MAG TPA: DUF167 family protein [Caulobacteraceae bacterium]
MRLAVRLTPRGGADRADGWALDPAGRPFLKIRVSAAPVDGEANAALAAFVAKALKLPKSAVKVVAGHTARLKQLEIDGAAPADLDRAFGTPPTGTGATGSR